MLQATAVADQMQARGLKRPLHLFISYDEEVGFHGCKRLIEDLDESGLKGFDTSIWYGVLAPKGTPPAIVKTLSDALVEAGQAADVQTQLQRNGSERLVITGDEMRKFIDQDVAKWKKVVEFAGIQNQN